MSNKNTINEVIALINQAIVAINTPEELPRYELREGLQYIRNMLEDYRAAKASEQPVDCREAFENFCINNRYIITNDNGAYERSETRALWRAWQAALATKRESVDR
jgi:hypothetical protein